MHIPDGILPVPVTGAGYAATVATTWYSIRRIKQKENPREDIPKASLLTAAFFVVSWIHIPVPPTSVHLVLNGLLGALLGYYAFPAILIGLFFHAVMFGHGGLTTLGVNVILLTNLPADLNIEIERAAIYALATAHIPLIFIEGTITALLTVFLLRVRPRILDGV